MENYPNFTPERTSDAFFFKAALTTNIHRGRPSVAETWWFFIVSLSLHPTAPFCSTLTFFNFRILPNPGSITQGYAAKRNLWISFLYAAISFSPGRTSLGFLARDLFLQPHAIWNLRSILSLQILVLRVSSLPLLPELLLLHTPLPELLLLQPYLTFLRRGTLTDLSVSSPSVAIIDSWQGLFSPSLPDFPQLSASLDLFNDDASHASPTVSNLVNTEFDASEAPLTRQRPTPAASSELLDPPRVIPITAAETSFKHTFLGPSLG
ncbi:hypothetical protein BC829DRAFT_423938 [Chytridium lagenaria]|nr:hypothetical protein BC829DRAFT_423938 [Chytridium lagenaria]